MNRYLGKNVEVKIDRPVGSKHPFYGFITLSIMKFFEIEIFCNENE